MCLAQGPQRSDAGEARTRGPSVVICNMNRKVVWYQYKSLIEMLAVSIERCFCTGAGSRISGKGVHMYKWVGGLLY